MTERVAWRVLATPADAAAEAAERLAAKAARAIEARGRFAVALPGGSTPAPLFELLASPAWRARLPWASTHVFWTDERCVSPEHKDSNFGLAERLLLRRLDVAPAGVHRIRGEADPATAAELYERELRAFAAERTGPALDLVLLGVGADGHTASLFPDSAAYRQSVEDGTDRWVLPSFVPRPGLDRVTLSVDPIERAGDAIFLVTGAGKSEVVARIARELRREAPSPTWSLPAARVRRNGPATWLLDEAAAGLVFGPAANPPTPRPVSPWKYS